MFRSLSQYRQRPARSSFSHLDYQVVELRNRDTLRRNL